MLKILANNPGASTTIGAFGTGWVVQLSQINEILATVAFIISITVGAITFYRQLKKK